MRNFFIMILFYHSPTRVGRSGRRRRSPALNFINVRHKHLVSLLGNTVKYQKTFIILKWTSTNCLQIKVLDLLFYTSIKNHCCQFQQEMQQEIRTCSIYMNQPLIRKKQKLAPHQILGARENCLFSPQPWWLYHGLQTR